MKILIIDQCSKNKSIDAAQHLDLDTICQRSREALVEREDRPTVPARDLYTGRQQEHINDAVDMLRAHGHDVDRYFISAGFGIVNETTALPPYDATFTEMDDTAIKQHSQELGLTADVKRLVTGPPTYDIIFLALGRDYYYSLDLDDVLATVPPASTAVLFNQEDREEIGPNVISLPARTDEARTHGVIVVALKGVYLHHFADHITNGAAVNNPDDIKHYCMTERSTQTDIDHPQSSS